MKRLPPSPAEGDPGALVDDEQFTPASYPALTNPFLTYVGGIDAASQPTMVSSGRLVASTLSAGRIDDPTQFPWHFLRYGALKRLRSLLQERGLAPRTINKALTLCRNVAKDAWLAELLSHEEYEKLCEVENLESHRLPAGRVVEYDEIARLLTACCAPDDLVGWRDAALIALLAGAGLREKEAVTLRWGAWEAVTGTVRVQGKKHRERDAFLEREYECCLVRLRERIVPLATDPVLPRLTPGGGLIQPIKGISTQSVHVLTAKRGAEAGLAKTFTPHDLRRSFITHQLEAGVDVLRLARAVGHASPKTTMLYDRRTKESDRRAIRREAVPVEEDRGRREFLALAAQRFRSGR